MAQAALFESLALAYEEWQSRKGRSHPVHEIFALIRLQALQLGLGNWRALDAMRQRAWEWMVGDPLVVPCPLCSTLMWKFNGQTWNASHVLAEAHGGSRAKSNLRALCAECNCRMDDHHMYDYVQLRYSSAVAVLALEPLMCTIAGPT